MYLPQLSPEISFCDPNGNNTLDIPSDSEAEEGVQQHPGMKKRVSFSDQLSTVIPGSSDDDAFSIVSSSATITSPIEEDRSTSPMARFVRKLSHELMDASTLLVAEKTVNPTAARDKFVPAPVSGPIVAVKKESSPTNTKKLVGFGNTNNAAPQPQKLSNKLLDMFQNKKLMQPQLQQQTKSAATTTTTLSNKSTQQSSPLTHVS